MVASSTAGSSSYAVTRTPGVACSAATVASIRSRTPDISDGASSPSASAAAAPATQRTFASYSARARAYAARSARPPRRAPPPAPHGRRAAPSSARHSAPTDFARSKSGMPESSRDRCLLYSTYADGGGTGREGGRGNPIGAYPPEMDDVRFFRSGGGGACDCGGGAEVRVGSSRSSAEETRGAATPEVERERETPAMRAPMDGRETSLGGPLVVDIAEELRAAAHFTRSRHGSREIELELGAREHRRPRDPPRSALTPAIDPHIRCSLHQSPTPPARTR